MGVRKTFGLEQGEDLADEAKVVRLLTVPLPARDEIKERCTSPIPTDHGFALRAHRDNAATSNIGCEPLRITFSPTTITIETKYYGESLARLDVNWYLNQYLAHMVVSLN